MPYSEDKEQIHRLFENLVKAWDAGDAQLYASYFTNGCDYVTFSGEHVEGAKTNARLHQQLLNSFALKASNLVGDGIYKIAFLTPEVTIVHQGAL